MTDSEIQLRRALIGEIMLVVRVNAVHRADEVMLALAFRSVPELREIARELHIHPLPGGAS